MFESVTISRCVYDQMRRHISTMVEALRWYADELPMPPALPNETDDEYTDRLTGADQTSRVPYEERRYRQCSIGFHDECTDPYGQNCKCPCHVARRALKGVVLDEDWEQQEARQQ